MRSYLLCEADGVPGLSAPEPSDAAGGKPIRSGDLVVVELRLLLPPLLLLLLMVVVVVVGGAEALWMLSPEPLGFMKNLEPHTKEGGAEGGWS